MYKILTFRKDISFFNFVFMILSCICKVSTAYLVKAFHIHVHVNGLNFLDAHTYNYLYNWDCHVQDIISSRKQPIVVSPL